jgi:hypothetical protein
MARAVLAVADIEGLLVAGEDDVDVLPVALVRLPDEVAGRVGVGVDVVVIEEPVLEDDLAVFAGDPAIDGRAAAARLPTAA